MARRRARAEKPAEEETVAPEEETAAEEPPAAEAEPAHEEDDHQGLPSLQFDEELSWRPAKPILTATLITRLEKLSRELAEFEQQEVNLDSLKHVASQLAHRNFVAHKDKGVKAYAACCLVDILRLFVPDAPFTDEELQMILGLFVKDILPALFDPSNPYDSQHKYVLTSLSEVKSVLLVADVNGSDELMLRLFSSTFDGVSACERVSSEEQLSKDVEIHLGSMLELLVDESSASIPAKVIDCIISQFLRAAPPGGSSRSRNKDQNGAQSTLLLRSEPAAYVMARNICNACSDKMSRYVSQYFSDVILNASRFATKTRGRQGGDESDEEDAASGPSAEDLKSLDQAHQLIRELWRAAPNVLQNVVPQLDAELSADNIHLRLIATETIGDMISGIGAAGPPPPPSIDPAAYPLPRLVEEKPASTADTTNALTRPFSPQSFAQTHPATLRNFFGRKNDKAATIRAAWVTAAGYILSTSAGGIGLSREEESELNSGLRDKLSDGEEKVRLSAVHSIELFEFRDIITQLGSSGDVQKEGSIFSNLSDRCRDRKPAVRVAAMVLLGKLWAAGTADLADGQEAVVACLSNIPSRIINVFYANDPDLNVLLDRVMFECLIPLKYPHVKGKNKNAISQADQDRIRAERILLMVKHLDPAAQKAFFAMQRRQPQFAKGVSIFLQQCEAYNGGTILDGDESKLKTSLARTFQWLGGFFPDPLKVRTDLQKFAKLNDRRSYQLFKYAVESETDFRTARRAINELIGRIQEGSASSCLDTLIPLLYRSSSLMFNRSHLATIMDYSKSDTGGFATVAHLVLNDIAQQNPGLFKAHAEELRKAIVEQAPTETKSNDPSVLDIMKAYSSYAKKYPDDVQQDRSFSQTLMNYALYGSPPKVAKYAVNIMLAKGDDKGKVTATNLLQKTLKKWEYGSPRFLNKLATVSQLERLAPTVTLDATDDINDMAIKKILRVVRTKSGESDPSWVSESSMNDELQAKCLSLRILVNQVVANQDETDAEDRVKSVVKLLKTFIVQEGEFTKEQQTPLPHRKRLRLLAGLLLLKLCTVRKYDDQVDPVTFNKLAEMVQDSELQVRRQFMEKLQNYLIRGRLKARFYTILFLVAFEPVSDLKNRIETWIRSRARHYTANKQMVMEGIMGRLIPLLAHHPDYSPDLDDLADFANYFLFYLGAVATEENISLIYRYAERVKQTRDAINPDASKNLYVLSDLAQAMIRKYQERRSWSSQAYSGKVGLPTGLYSALPSSEVAQEIAKTQYIPDELEERIDDLIRQVDRKKKRKSTHDWTDQAVKKPKTQMHTVLRAKAEPKKPKAAKKVSKKVKAAVASVPEGERRRSGRARGTSSYMDTRDSDDEAEMLEGVAEWDYVDSDGNVQGSDDDDDDDDNDDEEEGADESGEDAGEAAPASSSPAVPTSAKSNGKSTIRTSAVKAGVLTKLDRGAKRRTSSRRGGRADGEDEDMEGSE